MSVLVTGGAGYIGSHLVRYLADCGISVVVVDNLVLGHRECVDVRAKFYEADICDKEAVAEIMRMESVDSVVHFAAYSQVAESMVKPEKYFANNVGGTLCLLESMIAAGVKNIVFFSSAAVYGDSGGEVLSEELPLNPTNAYGETKLMMEKMLKWFGAPHGIKYVALRYFNAAGAHHSGEIGELHDPETHLIPIVIQAALGVRKEIRIFGTDYPTPDGTCVRDYVHVEDLAVAHRLALEHLLRGGESVSVNIGGGSGYSVRTIIETVKKITGREVRVVESERRGGDPAVLVADSHKAEKIFGFKVSRDIEDMIRDAWNFHSRHSGRNK